MSLDQTARIKFMIENEKMTKEKACSQFMADPKDFEAAIKEIEKDKALYKIFKNRLNYLEARHNLRKQHKEKIQEAKELVDKNIDPDTKLPLNSVDKEKWLRELYADNRRLLDRKKTEMAEQQKKLFIAGFNPFYIDREVPIIEEVREYWKKRLFQDRSLKIDDPGLRLNQWFLDQQKTPDQKPWAARSIAEIQAYTEERKKRLLEKETIFDQYHFEQPQRQKRRAKKVISRSEYQKLVREIDKLDEHERQEALKKMREYQLTE